MRMHLHGKITEVMSRARGDMVFGPGREVETSLERPSCEIHNPDFRPGTGADGKPRQPSGLCSECAAELAQKRRRTGSETEVQPDPRILAPLSISPSSDHHRMDAAFDAYNQRQAARSNHVLPGSPEETRALDRIEDLRLAERDADRRRMGRVVIERIESGDVIQYVVPRRGRGLIRRDP
jgi:hypothetical protein